MARHLILIGNSKYDDKYFNDLKYVKNDIYELNNFLIRYGDFNGGIKEFVNCGYDSIKKFLEGYLGYLGMKDDLFLYFSGHGEIGTNEKLNLICSDTNHKLLHTTSIDNDFLHGFLLTCRTKSKVILLDCCYSGAIIDGAKSKSKREILMKDIEEFSKAKGTCIIASSRKSQQSYKSLKNKSLFTECILNGLNSGEASYTNDEFITMEELWLYIDKNINKNIQIPVKFGKGEGNLYISRNPLESKKNNEEELKYLKKIDVYKKNKIIEQQVSLKFEVNSYVKFGRYNNVPILWKCLKEDNFGFLLVSKYIICLKEFNMLNRGIFSWVMNEFEVQGSNKWINSDIRKWLNSSKGIINYNNQELIEMILWGDYKKYLREVGFLNEFSMQDKQRISIYKHDRLEDKVFLLSRNEVEEILPDKNDRIKYLTEQAIEKSKYKSTNKKSNGVYWYWTRSPDYSNYLFCVSYNGCIDNWLGSTSCGNGGIVPALYLKSNICQTGKGSKKEPYIV